MTSISNISLTDTRTSKPFQRFLVKRKTVETADNSLGELFTWLKPGINETGTFGWSRAL
jgi:hypothetical protein